jgi:molecular chaperone GrpE
MAEKHTEEPAGRRPRQIRPRAGGPPARRPELAALKSERDDIYDRLLRKTGGIRQLPQARQRERRERRSVGRRPVDATPAGHRLRPSLNARGRREAAAYRKGVELIHAKLDMRASKACGRSRRSARFRSERAPGGRARISPEHREGEVIGELRRGYMLGERLLRPAMVKVAKA